MLPLYLNAELASSVLFILLALWGGFNAIRNQPVTPNYGAALATSQAILVALGLLYVDLRLIGQLANRTWLPLMYLCIGLVTFPCVRLYVGEQSPRRESFSIALACVFTSGMIIRALQTSIALNN